MKFKKLDWPLMHEAISNEDCTVLIQFINNAKRFTHGEQVAAFEEEWSKWLGVKYSVFVNSGASANLLTMAWLKNIYPNGGEVIVPTLTWVSDIATVLQNGFKPVFVDIDPRTLGMDWKHVERVVTNETRAIFLTHVLGFNATIPLPVGVRLIEDCCEAHGATGPQNKKLGTFGTVSNFSFYFAHHMTTVEGGMISTNVKEDYETYRMLRSHGMRRERTDRKGDKDFCFEFPGYNVRPTEIAAVLGRHQLKRLDENVRKRKENYRLFASGLNKTYRPVERIEGNSNYAFPLILTNPDDKLASRVERLLTLCNVEFRKGLSGGGNQLRQPYLKNLGFTFEAKDFPNVEHIHHYSWYIGNYPGLQKEKIEKLCELLNQLK